MKEYGASVSLDNASAQWGWSREKVIACVIQAASVFCRAQGAQEKPKFLWRREPVHGEALCWYAGPPSSLKRRMDEEGWREVSEFALAQGHIVPVQKGA